MLRDARLSYSLLLKRKKLGVFLSGRVLVVEDTPIRKLHSFEVPAPYPRTRACLTDPKMLELRENLISLLRKEVQA